MKIKVLFPLMITLLIVSLVMFTGCAKKQSMVTGDVTPEQPMVSEQAADQTQQDVAPGAADASAQKEADQEKWVDLEKTAAAPSPVEDIHFDFDSSSIRPDARDILRTNADYFTHNRVFAITIEGHCDERGTAEYNMALGERRAQEVKTYLINLGVKESIIKTVSFGEEIPLDAASNEEAWAANRRAHFVVNQ